MEVKRQQLEPTRALQLAAGAPPAQDPATAAAAAAAVAASAAGAASRSSSSFPVEQVRAALTPVLEPVFADMRKLRASLEQLLALLASRDSARRAAAAADPASAAPVDAASLRAYPVAESRRLLDMAGQAATYTYYPSSVPSSAASSVGTSGPSENIILFVLS